YTWLVKPSLFGAINVAAVKYFFPGKNININPFGLGVSLNLGIVGTFGVGFASSFLVDVINKFILSKVPQNARWANWEARGLSALGGGASLVALYQVPNPAALDDMGLMSVAG